MISRNFAAVFVALSVAACAAPPDAPDGAPEAPPEAEFSSPQAALNYHLLMGELALSRERFDEAADAFLAAMSLTDDPGVAERAVQLALHAGRDDDALRATARWRELEPDAVGPLEAELVAQLRAGDVQTAYTLAERLLERWRAPDEGAFQALGRLLVDESAVPAATQLMQRLAERHDTAAAWQVLGLLALRGDDLPLAARAAERARLQDPESPQAALLEARVLALGGDLERGLALLRAVVAEHPGDPTLRFALAGMNIAAGAHDDAVNELEQVLAQAPAYTDARWTLAMLLLQMRDADGAERHLRQLLADPLRRWDVPYYLGGVEELRGDWAAALEWFDQVEWGETLINARVKSVEMLHKLGRWDQAELRLGHLRSDFPEHAARFYQVEAALLARDGDEAAAAAVFDRALAADPDDVPLRYARALHRERNGDVAGAIADLRTVHSMQPDSAEAQNALGYLLADRGTPADWPEARRLIEQAVAQEPDNYAFLDSMGWVLYRLGDLDAARDWLQRSWDTQSDPEVGAHLGEVLWRLGRRDAARDIWQAAAGLDADHRVLRETLERLDPDLRGQTPNGNGDD